MMGCRHSPALTTASSAMHLICSHFLQALPSHCKIIWSGLIGAASVQILRKGESVLVPTASYVCRQKNWSY